MKKLCTPSNGNSGGYDGGPAPTVRLFYPCVSTSSCIDVEGCSTRRKRPYRKSSLVPDITRVIGIATNSPILSLLSLNNELYTQGGRKAVDRHGDGDGDDGGDDGEDDEGDKVEGVADMEQGG